MSELVSIITPCFNSEKFLDECISSVINQTYQNWEMLIVDDNSSDNSFILNGPLGAKKITSGIKKLV